jgi:very-short-patch-repair endonuclease
VEYDGREFHDDPDARRYDEQRRDWLRERGWTVIVVDKESFSSDALDTWIDQLRQALRLH